MFAREKTRAPDPGKVATILGAGTSLEGTLTGEESVRLDGFLKGSVDIAGDVIVAETAKVQAKICARAVKIAGTVEGDIHSKGLVELTSTAVVEGDVICVDLVVDKGAVLNGSTRMSEESAGESGREQPTGGDEAD
ncbi:MAG: polymer-forming cytoskeletal protein [Bacillota bacterium]